MTVTCRKEKCSSDVKPTLDDFINSGWEDAFQGDEVNSLSVISNTLAKKGQIAAEEGRSSQSKVLQLLADACSMMLQPMSMNEPFKPFFRSQTARSAIPNDFSEQDIDYFIMILPSINKPNLKARLSDLIWLKKRDRVNLALEAIDSYVMIPITQDSFTGDGGRCWLRAVYLARMLKDKAGARLENIMENILEALRNSSESDGFLAKWLADMLQEAAFGASYETEIAEKLVAIAEAFKSQKEFYRSREYYESASHWFSKIEKEQACFQAIASKAGAWCDEATSKETACYFNGFDKFIFQPCDIFRFWYMRML